MINNLSSFTNLQTVYFGKQTISYEDKQKLEQNYPNINFNVNVYYNIYGKQILEDEKMLDLSNTEIDNNFSENLALLSNLEEVNLYNHLFTKDEQINLQKEFPNITFKWKVQLLSEMVDYNIETLDLSNKKIEDIDDLKKSLILLKNVKTIDMSNTNLTNEQLGTLREMFPNIKIDWIVHFGKWSLKTDAVSFSVLITEFNYKRMTEKDIEVLKYCTELQALDLGHQAITDVSVIGEYLPNLRVLILADNKIKDITPLANLKHLHYLELFMNDVQDLTQLISCTELVDLNLCYNYHIFNLEETILKLPLLERLWMVGNGTSSVICKSIRQAHPNIKLVTTGAGSTNSGWRTHGRYYKMIDMYKNNYISDVFLKYDNQNY